ncbi:MAG: ETC complex I subunit [Robiginitomaculum sp.]|nr:ETC complex I subunit [Robiginitomaculum sp.]
MSALIYQPDANAMQSGRAKSNIWILEFESHSHRTIDALTGWTGSDDTDSQVKMKFDTCARAERYAKQHGIEYTVIKKTKSTRQSKSYSDNFATDRRQSWTH